MVSAREEVLRARRTLLHGGNELSYYENRGLTRDTIARAFVGYEPEVYFPGNNGQGYKGPAFLYPCIGGGKVRAIHYKSQERDEKGKRHQKWGAFADDLPHKGHGKKPEQPAKIIPFGLETLEGLEPGSLVVLCCGEEDALSLRQVGLAALSQAGAGLLEPVYAAELTGFEVVVFYDAGEEAEAYKDALKLKLGGAAEVRMVEWPPETPHGTDINGRLVEDPKGFERWAVAMSNSAKPVSDDVAIVDRNGVPDSYTTLAPAVPESRPSPTLRPEALHGLPSQIVRAIEPHTEADQVALLANLLVSFGNAIGRGSYVRVGPDRHHLNLYVALVGETAKGRKGTSWGPIRELMHAADPEWADERVQNGLSSGEGLIYALRDPETTDEDEED